MQWHTTSVRSENKELFQRLADLDVEIYQQPAGFEDSVITCWKLEKQAQAASSSIGLRDMFAGALSDSALNCAAALGQLPVFIRGKMTAAVQVTDTDVAFRLKAKVRRRQKELRKELQRLAEAEGTRATFKCGTYEVLRTLAAALEDVMSDFKKDETLKKACVRNAWTVLRPKLSEGAFVKASEEKWFQDGKLKVGQHRLRSSWVEKRFNNLDDQGMPKDLPPLTDKDKAQEGEAGVHGEPGDLSALATWQDMVASGELTEAALQDLSRQAWLAMEINDIEGIEGLEEAKQLLRTPAQRRQELGLDKYLTSQKPDAARQKKRQQGRKDRAAVRAESRKGALTAVRELRSQGYSAAQACQMTVVPKVGSKKVKKSKLLKVEIKKQRVMQALAKKREKARAKADAEAKAAEDAEALKHQSDDKAWQDSRFPKGSSGAPELLDSFGGREWLTIPGIPPDSYECITIPEIPKNS